MNDWEKLKVSDFARVTYGYTAKANTDEIGPKFLRITDIQDGLVNWETVPFCEVAEDDLEKHRLESNDIVFARTGATTGKSFLISIPPLAIAASYLIRLRIVKPKISPDFLSKYFQTTEYWELIGAGTSGSAQGGFNASKLGALPVPVPPLPEQKRIVEILDEAFAGIATATAHAERNLQNVRDLFQTVLQSTFEEKGEDWLETSVGSAVKLGLLEKPIDGNHGEIHPKKAEFVDSGVPFLMASDLKNWEVDQTNCNFISESQAKTLRKGFARNGDVLISHKGTIGRVAILRTDLDFVVLTPQVTYYRIIDGAQVSNEFLAWFFESPRFQAVLGSMAGSGSTRAYLGITRQLELPLTLPPLKTQRAIVKKLDAIAAETRRLESIYQRKLDALAELKQSLLQRAFAGDL